MDLLALQTIPFSHVNARASPRWHSNGLAQTDSMLAYGHRGWPTASLSQYFLLSLLSYLQ